MVETIITSNTGTGYQRWT